MQDDSTGPQGVSLILVCVLVTVWTGWLVFGTVKVYAVTETARLEVDSTAHGVQPQVGGVVVATRLTLGKMVNEGDELLTLDSTAEQLQRDQEQVKLKTAQRALEALQRELVAENDALRAQETAAGAAVRVAQAKQRVALTLAQQSEAEDRMIQELRTNALATGLEAMKSTHETGRQRVEAVAANMEANQVAASSVTTVRDRISQIVRLERDISAAGGDIEEAKASIERLSFEIQRRTLRASTSGVVADLTPVPPGTTLNAGQRVATIVPPGSLRVVAQLPPAVAVGRVQRGQAAVMRLDAFPWAEYGVVMATVSEVANEPQNGTIRTELAIKTASAAVPLTHGLTGSVEIEVERTAPLMLLLRAAGQVSAGPAKVPEPPQKPSAQLP